MAVALSANRTVKHDTAGNPDGCRSHPLLRPDYPWFSGRKRRLPLGLVLIICETVLSIAIVYYAKMIVICLPTRMTSPPCLTSPR